MNASKVDKYKNVIAQRANLITHYRKFLLVISIKVSIKIKREDKMLKRIKNLLLSLSIVAILAIPSFATSAADTELVKFGPAAKPNRVFIIKDNKDIPWTYANKFGKEIRQIRDNKDKDSRVFADYRERIGQWYDAGFATVSYRIPKITKNTKFVSHYDFESGASFNVYDYGNGVELFLYEAPHNNVFADTEKDFYYCEDIIYYLLNKANNPEKLCYKAHIKDTAAIVIYG
jgi:hypothetical protein